MSKNMSAAFSMYMASMITFTFAVGARAEPEPVAMLPNIERIHLVWIGSPLKEDQIKRAGRAVRAPQNA